MEVFGSESHQSRQWKLGATSHSLVTNLSKLDEPELLTASIDHLFPPLPEEHKIPGFSKGISSSRVFLGSARMLSRAEVVRSALGVISQEFGFSTDGSLCSNGLARNLSKAWLKNCNAIISVLSSMFEPFCSKRYWVAGSISIDSQSLQSYDGRFRQFYGWPGVVSQRLARPIAIQSKSSNILFGLFVKPHECPETASIWTFPSETLEQFAWFGLNSVADLNRLIKVSDSLTCFSDKESDYYFDHYEVFPWFHKVDQIPLLDGGISCAINRRDLVHRVVTPPDVTAQASQTPANPNWYIVNGRGVSLCRYFLSDRFRIWEDQVRLCLDPDGYLIGLGISRLEVDRACLYPRRTYRAITASEVGVC